MKLNLKNVTLFGLDTNHHHLLQKAAKVCTDYVDFGEIILLSDSYETNVHNYKDYNRFMIKDLHRYINTDFVLIIQADGFILNPDAWSDTFLDFDYIGAPWLSGRLKNHQGNGGFSLRSKRLIDRTSELAYTTTENEDIFISITAGDTLRNEGMRWAPIELAAQFSTECKPWKNSFGFHDPRVTNFDAWKDKAKYDY